MAHLVPKQIVELPYVDRVPNPSERPDQRRIEWIRNGDCLGAADHAADNSGELNRGPVQVQKNAVTLIENDKIIKESLDEIIERVNSHDDALGSIGDDNLATKVEKLEETVEPLDAKITQNTQSIFLLSELAKATRDKVGTKDALDINDRTVFDDLFWIKKEIGNWANKDVNDNDDVTKPDPSGIKARLVAHGLGISANERRIRTLENDWEQSDVGALTSAVQDIRSELGRVVDAPTGGVYPWIITAAQHHVKTDAEIQSLKDIVGGSGGQTLDERIRKNTTDITNNKTDQDDINRRLVGLTATIGDSATPMSLAYTVNQNQLKINTMNAIIGETEDAGMQKKVNDISNEMGSDTTVNSIKGRLATNEASLGEVKRDVATINTKIGNNTAGQETGIYRRIVTLESDLNSTGTGIKARLSTVETGLTTKISDAPNDGKKYIRKSQSWEELGSAAGVPEAPTDGKEYVRKSSNWTVANAEGLTLPTGKSVNYVDGSNTKNIISKVDAGVEVGHDGTSVLIKGSNVTIGSDSGQVILKSSAGNEPKVQSGTDSHEVLHKGNFPDATSVVPHVRIRGGWVELIHGGYQVSENATVTNVTTTPAAIALDTSKVSTLALNTNGLGVSNGKLTFGADVADRVVDLVADFRVSSSIAQDTTFELKNKAGTSLLKRIIKSDEWSTSKGATIRMSVPVKLTASEELSIFVSSTVDATVTVSDGIFYAYSI